MCTPINMLSARRRLLRRASLGAVVGVVALALTAVSASADPSPAAGSAGGLGSVEAPVAGRVLGGGILGFESGARDPWRPLRGAARARGGSGGGWFGRDRGRSRGRGFVRDARGFADLDVPGASVTVASGSNRGGLIVGYYLDGQKRFRGFIRDGRRFRRIDFPGAEGTFAAAIDDQGRVVGSYTNERATPAIRSAEHGFLLDERGRFRRIDVPGATATRPEAINNRGQIAGAYVDSAGALHGYLQDRDGSVITLDPPGAGATVATDVDDRGRVVGGSVDAKQTAISGFVRDPDGRFTTIAHPDAGFYGTVPQGIDNQGRIAGVYSDASDRVHGFVLDDGAYTSVDAPAAPGNTEVLDIDDRGRLVGASGHVSYGYLADARGRLIEIDAPDVASDTFPGGLNNQGEIVGSFDVGSARRYHGFVRDRRERFRRIDFPGARGTAATRINDSGQIVGHYSNTNDNPNVAADVRGFLLDRRGRFAEIAVPGARQTQPTGVNNRGEIVGVYTDTAGLAHGFLRGRDGLTTTIDVPDARVTLAFDLNDRGQVAGTYIDQEGRVRGFRRDPSGEIATIDAPGAIQTRVRGINNRGQIAIDTVDAQLVHHGFLLDQGRFTEIRPRGAAGNGSLATDVDDRGRVLGYVL
jgi:uncharacterized membrane protein